MRAPVLLLAAALLVAAHPGAAGAGAVPPVGRGSCSVDADHNTATCLVQLSPNPAGEFGSAVYSGYGVATLDCPLHGTRVIRGGYGFEWHPFPHGADLCKLTLVASGGSAFAYVQ